MNAFNASAGDYMKIPVFKISRVEIVPNLYHPPENPCWVAWCTLWSGERGPMLGMLHIFGDLNRPPPIMPPEFDRAFPNSFYNMTGLNKRQRLFHVDARNIGPAGLQQVTELDVPGMWNHAAFYCICRLRCGVTLAHRMHMDLADAAWKGRGACIARSYDDGLTWPAAQNVEIISPHVTGHLGRLWINRIIELRDGTVAAVGYGIQRGDENEYYNVNSYLTTSSDHGQSWSAPILIAPNENGQVGLPEPAVAELSNGDLLVICRAELKLEGPSLSYAPNGAPRRQVRVTKKAGRWMAGPVKLLDIPHGGQPELRMTRQGVLLYISHEGVWATVDDGDSWHRTTLPPAGYYPQSVQLDDGRILAVGHRGNDYPYPPPEDMTVWGVIFQIDLA